MLRFCKGVSVDSARVVFALVWALIGALLIPCRTIAQEFTPDPDWRFQNFNSKNHFTNSPISQLAMDDRGYIWAASNILRRFDGYRTIEFNAFEHPEGTLRNNYGGIVHDNSGRVWITARGLCDYDYRTDRFNYIKTDAAHNFIDAESFFAQGDYLWFVTEFGLARLDTRTRKVFFTTLKNIHDPLCNGLVNDSVLLISSREKIYFYNIRTGRSRSRTLVYNDALLKIFCIKRSAKRVFLGTNDGLFELLDDETVRPLCPEPGGLGIDDMIFLPADKEQKYLLMATEGKGIEIFNTSLGKIQYHYVHDDHNPFSLPSNGVSGFFLDKMGRLWLSGDIGISMLDIADKGLKVRLLSNHSIYQLGINKIAADKYDSSRVWMCSYNQGMLSLDWRTKALEKMYNQNPDFNRLYDFAQLTKDRWLLATQRELVEWNPQRGVSRRMKLPLNDSLELICNIRRIIPVDENTCYITTNHGLFKYSAAGHKITVAVRDPEPPTPFEALKYILLDGYHEKDSLWIASRNGMFRYSLKDGSFHVFRGPGGGADYFLLDIAPAPPNLLIGAAGQGLTIFNRQTGRFTIVNKLGNMIKPGVGSVIATGNTVWAGTDEGVFSYDLETNKTGEAELDFGGSDVSPSSPFAKVGNDVVFGFRDGFAYFTPEPKTHLTPSDPIIEQVLVNNIPVSDSLEKHKLSLTHSDNSLNITFTSFLYNDPDDIQFRYGLIGADHEWHDARGQRSANYAQLSPGRYTFYLQSGNKSGFWNKNLASFTFVIEPPYWETWWFRVLIAAAVAVILYRLYRYKIEHLQTIENIRANIASDFHDDLGSTLSSISIFSQVAVQKAETDLTASKNMVSDIGTRARAMINSMNDMVWMIKPDNDTLSRLVERMEEFAHPMAEAKEIRFSVLIDQNMMQVKVDMMLRKNLFLVFKEAFNNAVKYSRSEIITVRFDVKHKKTLSMEITDNGCGFDPEQKSKGNGLGNMRKRAAEMRGKLKIITAPGSGTIICLVCEIT